MTADNLRACPQHGRALLQEAIARNAIKHVQVETRRRIAQLPPNGKPRDGLLAALDLPADEVLDDVVKRIAAGDQPTRAAVRAFDAWIKRRRAGMLAKGRELAALRNAQHMLRMATAIEAGQSVQDWTASEPYIEAEGTRAGLVQRGGHLAIESVDCHPAASMVHSLEREALTHLQAAISKAYQKTVFQVCNGFGVVRVERCGRRDFVLHDKRGRRARAYIDDGSVHVYEVEGMPVDSASELIRAIAQQVRRDELK